MPNNQNKNKRKGLIITMPDVPPKKEIKMWKDWLFIIKTFEDLTGESGTNVSEIKKRIKELKQKT